MSGESAANTLWTVGRDRVLERLEVPSEEDKKTAEADFKQPVLDQYRRESDPFYATARVWDDGILDPAQTRTALGLAFSVTLNAPFPSMRYGTFRM
jgi:3-methylcrotonyl-CoA carboxylase beta subunit